MNDCRERNQKIYRMALEGVSHMEIAQAFRLSPSRIWLVVHAIRSQNALTERRRNLVEEIRRADDLDKLWEVTDLVDALRALTAARNALLRHFGSLKMGQISLREMMNLAIPETVDSDGWYSPLMRITFIGPKGYQSILNGLSKIDWNERCRQEWERKLVWLERFLRDRGHPEY
jgi:hypothetical protein